MHIQGDQYWFWGGPGGSSREGTRSPHTWNAADSWAHLPQCSVAVGRTSRGTYWVWQFLNILSLQIYNSANLLRSLNLPPEKFLDMGVKVEDLEILDIQKTGWQNKSHLTFALEGTAASPMHLLQVSLSVLSMLQAWLPQPSWPEAWTYSVLLQQIFTSSESWGSA